MRWMWIDNIVSYEPGRSLVAIKNVSLAEEHLHDHFPAGEGANALPLMPASLMLEGMAQTAGILVGAQNQFKEKVILAKVAKASIERDVVPGQTIQYEATLQRIDSAGASTIGTITRIDHVRNESIQIGEVDIMFSHIDQNMRGESFPDHNFVFSDNLRTILRSGALAEMLESVD